MRLSWETSACAGASARSFVSRITHHASLAQAGRIVRAEEGAGVGGDGRRPVFGSSEQQQADPHFCDNVLFYEYFHGDDGSGVGASHQTGWTGLVAKLLQQSGD